MDIRSSPPPSNTGLAIPTVCKQDSDHDLNIVGVCIPFQLAFDCHNKLNAAIAAALDRTSEPCGQLNVGR